MTALGFSLYIGRGGLWLRIPTGHGFSLAWDNPRPLFSERSGKRRASRGFNGLWRSRRFSRRG